MRISQVLALLLWQLEQVIPLAVGLLLVLPLQAKEHDGGQDAAHEQEAETDGEPSLIERLLLVQEDVGADDAGDVSDADLHRGTDGALVVSGEVVGEPDDDHGLRNVDARDEEEACHIFDVPRETGLAQQDDVADGSDADAEHQESVAVTETVGQPGCGERNARAADVDGDGV